MPGCLRRTRKSTLQTRPGEEGGCSGHTWSLPFCLSLQFFKRWKQLTMKQQNIQEDVGSQLLSSLPEALTWARMHEI